MKENQPQFLEIYKLLRKTLGSGIKCLHEPLFFKSEIQNLKKCIESTFVSSKGKFVKKFSNKIKKITKSKYVLCVNSATSALHLSLLAINLKENDIVVIPNLNFIAAANAVKYLKADLLLADIEAKNLGLDFDKLEIFFKNNVIFKNKNSYLKKNNKVIRAIILLHTFGHPADLYKAKNFCKKYNLYLIEDAAEALGSYYKRKHVGTFGDIGIISFNGNKVVTSGSGGAILTNSRILFEHTSHISQISKKNHKWKFLYDKVGYNYRMANINAALGYSNILNLNLFLKYKRKLFNIYLKNFKNSKFFEIFKEPKNCKSNYWLQTLLIKNSNRKKLNFIIDELNKKGIFVRAAWTLLHEVSYLKKSFKTNLSNSIKIYNRIINLPSSPQLILKNKKR